MRLLDPLQTSLNGRPVLDYALLDFGTISTNSRYIKANPFVNSGGLIVVAQVYLAGGWQDIRSISSGLYFYGVFAGVEGSDSGNITVSTGSYGIAAKDVYMVHRAGSALGGVVSSAPCRVHVWRVGV